MKLEEEPTRPVVAPRKPHRRLMPTSPVSSVPIIIKTDDDEAISLPSSRRCGLVQCRRADCNLTSHRQFAAARRGWYRRKKHSPPDTSLPPMPNKGGSEVLEKSLLRIERQLGDGFPTLPSQRGSSSVFRELVHHYFTLQIDRLIQLHSPHLDRRRYKSTMVEHALSNDIFCVCIAANAKTDRLMRGRIRKPDRSSEIVYATTANVLRQKLANFRQTDIDWLLVLVVALVGFDLAFERTEVLQSHREALAQMIALKGGIHTVGHILPYVLNTDRFIATITGQYPLFKSTPLFPTTPRGPVSSSRYGHALRQPEIEDCIDQQVLQFCLDECRLIHLIEEAQISTDPQLPPASDPSVLPHYLYLRDRLFCEGTCLHADYHENQNTDIARRSEPTEEESRACSPIIGKSRCLVLATLTIDYVIAHGNYYTIKGPFLANQFKSIFERQAPSVWARDIDMLIWVLFAFAALVDGWEHYPWAIQLLRRSLKEKSRDQWPRLGWENEVLAKLKDYVWSSRFDTEFRKVCNDLEEGI